MTFVTDEKQQSQVPALLLFESLGFIPLSQSETANMRGHRLRSVVLDEILVDQLLNINQFTHREREYKFDLEDAQLAVQRLKPTPDRLKGLQGTNQEIYDMLILGTTITKTIDGDTKSYSFRYIDWENVCNNAFHVTAEMEVERTFGNQTRRLDIIAFVNGIPFVVIENKRSSEDLKKAGNQLINYQSKDNIPQLFYFAQLLMVMNRQRARFATVGTSWKFWHVWKEASNVDEKLAEMINRPLKFDCEQSISDNTFTHTQSKNSNCTFTRARRIPTDQDRAIFSLCHPERLLDLVRRFTIFEKSQRIVARHQQYYGVCEALIRVNQFDAKECRKGGVIWHTQGSGKSLTMVMFARALALDNEIINPRIVIVTDREDLDIQIKNTFKSCRMEPVRATSGKHLVRLIQSQKPLITTIVNKFDTAIRNSGDTVIDEDSNIFVLVDESHRTHSRTYSGSSQLAFAMRRMLPKACYLGFTGTPLFKSEKVVNDTFSVFGDLIHKYTIDEAVKDGAVVPLLYEGRYVEQQISRDGVDRWFAKISRGLTKSQQADLKEKYSRAKYLSQTAQTIFTKALDISEHYRQTFRDSPYKAQLVAPSKAAAVRFKKELDKIGHVSSAVIMSPPNEHEGVEEVDIGSKNLVNQYWKEIVGGNHREKEFNRLTIDAFKNSTDPEILIVVSKLLTGFDAPRNAVLYICKPLQGHNLLQAIARVNRLYQDSGNTENTKRYGLIIDYEGLLGELDEALTSYSALSEYDTSDIVGVVNKILNEIERLTDTHARLWDVLKPIKNKQDMEEIELYLGNEKVRQDFYSKFRAFSRCLHISLSSVKIYDKFKDTEIKIFTSDWKRFSLLKKSVRIRYQEAVDMAFYEPKITKLLDDHVSTLPSKVIVETVNIQDSEGIKRIVQEKNLTSASKADRIAYATRKTITEKIEEDPAFYKKFSKLIEETILAYREKRLSEINYLNKVTDIATTVGHCDHGRDIPKRVIGDPDSQAVFGILHNELIVNDNKPVNISDIADYSREIIKIIKDKLVVNIWSNEFAKNTLINAIDDFICDVLIAEKGIDISSNQIEELSKKIMRLSQARFPR